MPGQRTYKVTLAEDERTWLRKMLASGKAAARKLNHARILLYADQDVEGLRRTDQQIADTLGVGLRTVARVRQRASIMGSATFGHSASPDSVTCWHIMDGNEPCRFVSSVLTIFVIATHCIPSTYRHI